MILNRRKFGWIYRQNTDENPAQLARCIVVSINRVNVLEKPVNPIERRFSDNSQGAQEAADFISQTLGTDNWRLEDCAFLGYRIVIPANEHLVTSGAAVEAIAGPEIDDSVKFCPECETPNQFGELCERCRREIDAEQAATREQ